MAGLEKPRKEGRLDGKPKVITDRGKVKEPRQGPITPGDRQRDELIGTTVARICRGRGVNERAERVPDLGEGKKHWQEPPHSEKMRIFHPTLGVS